MATNVINFIDVSLYRKSYKVLENVNFSILPGEFYYLIGKVGSGKTTLIKSMNAEIPIYEGQAEIAGYKLHDLNENDIPYLRRKIGVVFQDFQLLTDRTLYANLEFVLRATGWSSKKNIKERINETLKLVGLKDLSQKKPHELSGGEQQKGVLARAIVNEPEIILADEPTGNLDPNTADEIMNILFNLNRNGKTVIMVTHNYSLMKKFPAKALHIENGTVNEENMMNDLIDFSQIEH